MFVFTTYPSSATALYGSPPTKTEKHNTHFTEITTEARVNYGAPAVPPGTLSLSPIEDNNCGDVVYNIVGLNSVSNLTYTIVPTSITLSGVSINASGNLILHSPVTITASGNVGEANFKGTYVQNGTTFNFNILFYVYRCCTNTQTSNYIFKDGDLMSSQFTNSNIAGVSISIEGNVIADNNYQFDDCTFYFSRDAKLTINPNRTTTMQNCILQSCDTWRWNGIEVTSTATFDISNSNMSGAIRGIELANNTTFSANNNNFNNNYNSILFLNVNTSTHSISNNAFWCEPFGFNNIIIAPNSTVNPVVSIELVTAIVADNSTSITIGNTINTYNTTSPNGFSLQKFAYIYITKNSDVNIYNQTFGFAQECVNVIDQSYAVIGGTATNQPNTFDQTTTFGAANYSLSTGVYVYDKSGAYIEENLFNKLQTGIKLKDCGPTNLGYSASELIQNNIDAKAGIIATASVPTSARIRMYNNIIYALNTGIKVSYYSDGFSGGISDNVYINNNSIETKAPNLTNYNSRGIYLIENTITTYVGDNTIFTSSPYTPGTTNHPNVIGINIKGLCNAQLSGNDITRYDYGLVMDNDDGATLFSCETYHDCMNAVYYKNITSTQVQHVVNGNDASMVVFDDVNLTGAIRVDADAVPSGTFNQANWFWNNSVVNQDPTGGTNFVPYFLQNGTKANSTCISLPNSKTNRIETIISRDFNFTIYPIPNNGYFSISSNSNHFKVSIYSLNGKKVYSKISADYFLKIELNINSGIYILEIENQGDIYHEKIIISD